MPEGQLDDVIETSNYVAAMEHGLKRLKEGFPISLRLLCEIHVCFCAKAGERRGLPANFAAVKTGLAEPARGMPPSSQSPGRPDGVPRCI